MLQAIDQCRDFPDADRHVIERAIDVGQEAVPHIAHALPSYGTSKRRIALEALAYLGGDEAIKALHDEILVRPDPDETAALCAALASRGTAEDRAFLIRTLETRPQSSVLTEWQPIIGAALSLGVLRAVEAIPALERMMRVGLGIPEHAARVATQWIRTGPFSANVVKMNSPEAPILAAVLQNGIPRSEESTEFSDIDRQGTWVREGRAWSFRPGMQANRLPCMGFHVHKSPDSLRAVVSTGLNFGPANGIGYDYVLWRDQTWKVKALFFVWIS